MYFRINKEILKVRFQHQLNLNPCQEALAHTSIYFIVLTGKLHVLVLLKQALQLVDHTTREITVYVYCNVLHLSCFSYLICNIIMTQLLHYIIDWLSPV